jgi:D-alanine-D-alanine ligase
MHSSKIRVGVLVGGASHERDISLASGRMIAEQLPRERYDVLMLDTLALMARNPRLSPTLRERAAALIGHGSRDKRLPEGGATLPEELRAQVQKAADSAAPATDALMTCNGDHAIDVAFLALHGPYGEDGTIQGLLELIGIPYVGSGVLASALAMDKVMAKKVLDADGVATPRGLVVERVRFQADPDGETQRACIILPAVVKPVREGSSIGMTLVHESGAMRAALAEALACDARALVEERVVGTELTVGVLGNRDLAALPVVEIVSKREFFDYRAKYDPTLSEEICPARIPESVARTAHDVALRAHRALGCRGVSRVDMIQSVAGLVVLEVNTLPGMTINSLLPKAARAAGIAFPDLLDRLIQLALEAQD